jgi:enoyl-CoA hydratase
MSLLISMEPPIARVRIDRPARLKALDLEAFRQLDALIDEIHATPAIRALVITATGDRALSAGADINELSGIGPDEASERATHRRNGLQRLAELEVPSVAVMDGLAKGGGVELAAACTFRLATARAQFSMPEINLGLLPGAGATQRLPRLIGEARALEMMVATRRIGVDEALQWGLVTRRIGDVEADVEAFLTEITRLSRTGLRGILRAVVRGQNLPMREALAIEGEELAVLSRSPDGIEGIAAFLEKRPPRFNRGA